VLTRGALATAGVATGGVALNELAPTVFPPRQSVDPNRSYWSLSLPAANPPLPAAIEADVVIIGGGLTGLSTAYYLRERLPGRRIVLLEALRCGNGASARNGAMLLTSTADRYLALSADPELDRRIHALTVTNIGDLQRLAVTVGIDPEIDTGGALHVLRHPDAAADARAGAARLGAAGIPVEYWDRERTAEALGTTAYAAALFNPAAGQLHPGKLVALWKRAAEMAGVEIYENTHVTHIDEGATHVVHTAAGHRVRAPRIVLATNAYGVQLGYLARAAAGVWDYVAMTPPLAADVVDALGWRSRAPFDDDRTETYYLGVTRDNRLHIGGGPVDYLFNGAAPDLAAQLRRHTALQRALTALYPPLETVGFEHCWAGNVDMSFDASPAIGRLGAKRNLYYAIGFSGHGVNLTSIAGRILADLIAGRDEEWRWFPYLDRLPPYLPNEPWRWLAVHADLVAIRATDR
jgi:glycine/D-amino acid oxidase-like deaminating enzyme